MSLLVSLILKDGIIMSSDSRTTWKKKDSVTYTDKTYKTILMDNRIGISHCLNATVNGITIHEHLKNFIKINKGKLITRIPTLLKQYFLELNPNCKIEFLICGYIKEKPYAYRVETQGEITKLVTSSPNVYWAGERDVPSRLFSEVYLKRTNQYKLHSSYKLKLDSMSIPEGIDFSEFIINTAKQVMSYQECDQTIGGPIDILILKPYESYWYRRK